MWRRIEANEYVWLMCFDFEQKSLIPELPVLYSELYLRMRGWLTEDLDSLETIIAALEYLKKRRILLNLKMICVVGKQLINL
jgi:hypothetical protein